MRLLATMKPVLTRGRTCESAGRLAKSVAALAWIAMLLLTMPPPAQAQSADSQPEESSCTRKAGVFQPGKAVEPPIALTPDLPAQTVNFGGGRGWKFIDVVLRASRPLPTDFSTSQLDLEVLRRLVRQGGTTTTVASRPLNFTEPRLNPRRDVITFTICVNGEGLNAGHYEGAVIAEGPDGIGPANLAISANAKNGTLFWSTLIITTLLVLVLLVWRGATTEQADKAKEVAEAVKGAPVAGGNAAVPEAVQQQATKVVEQNARWNLRSEVLANPMFWVSTLASAALATAAAFTIYSQNISWGADPAVDVFAVAAAVLAAAGFRSLILTTAGK